MRQQPNTPTIFHKYSDYIKRNNRPKKKQAHSSQSSGDEQLPII